MGDGDAGRIPPSGGNAPWENICRESGDQDFPIDASIDLQVTTDLPNHGADSDHRLLEDWFTSYHIPLLSDIFGRGGAAFGLRGGDAEATVPLRMRAGALCIGEDLVELDGVYFEDLIGDEGPPFRIETISRDDDGLLRMRGNLVTGIGSIDVIDNFANKLRIFGDYPYAFPFGFDTDGDLVFDVDARDTIVDPLPYLTALRMDGIPATMDVSTLLALSEELVRVQESGQQPPADPALIVNVPQSIQDDPLSIIPSGTLGARITIVDPVNGGEQRLRIPEIQGNPALEVLFGNGTSELTIDGEFTNQTPESWLNDYEPSRVEATVNAQFDIISFKIGDQEITAPIQGDWEIAGSATGILPTEDPNEIWAHISANGWVAQTGDIVVPAMEGFPEIRMTRGTGATRLESSLSIAFDDGEVTPSGTITGTLDWDEVQIGAGDDQVIIPGVNGNFDLTATDAGITAELSGQVMLPQQSFPLPLPVAIERGYLDIDHFNLFLDPTIEFDPATQALSASGTLDSMIALEDVALNVDGTDAELEGTLSVDGAFVIDQNLINASVHTDLHLEGSGADISANANLGVDLSVNDYGYCDPDGSYVTWRHLDIENITGGIGVNADGISIHAADGTLSDGPVAELNGRVIRGGVHVVADFEGMAPGLITDATINTQLTGLQVVTPQGTATVSGQLVGQIQLVNISTDPSQPDLRPVVGSLRFELRDGTITMTQDGETSTLLDNGTLVLQDNPSGEMSLTAHARHPIGSLMDRFGASELRETLGIPSVVQSQLDVPEILLAPSESIQAFTSCTDTVHLSGVPPVCSTGNQISFYNVDELDEVNIPSIVLAMPPLFRANGSARIADIQSGNPTTEFRGHLPFGHRTLGPVETHGGRVLVRKRADEEIIRVSVIPPTRIEVPSFTQERDGITYEYQVELNNSGTIHASINPNTQRVRVRSSRSHPPTMTGTVTITARDGDGTVLGSGELEIETGFELTGSANRNSAHFTLSVPETGIVARTTAPITAGDLAIAEGATINLPIRNFEAGFDVDMRTGSVTAHFNVPEIGTGDDAPEIIIPGVDIAGMGDTGHLEDIRVDLAASAPEQIWEVTYANDQVTVRTRPGTDGEAVPLQFNARITEGTGALTINVASTTLANVSALIPILQGEDGPEPGTMEFTITSFELNSEVDGEVVRPLPVNLNDLNTLLNIPGVTATFNPATREIRVRVTPPQPTLPTPPATYEDFFSWTESQWRTYADTLGASDNPHLFRQSARGAQLPGAITEFGMPTGQGDIVINLTEPLDETFSLNDPELVGRLTGIVERLGDRRRIFPNPPPRQGEGDSVIFSEAQSRVMRSEAPYGTLFFPQFLNAEGQVQSDPDMANILSDSLGIPRVSTGGPSADGFVLNQRIELDEVLDILMADEASAIPANISRSTLESLIRSYFDTSISDGTMNRDGSRALITIGNIRSKLGEILASNEEGVRNIQAHHFVDSAYFDGEGTFMQYTSFLSAAPEQIGTVLENLSDADDWDPWLRSGNGLSGNFLGDYDYTVTSETHTSGNVRVYHIHLTPDGNDSNDSLDAYTRTVRLVPLNNGGTLMVWEEHIDLAGNDQDIRAPRRILPDRPVIDINTASSQLLQAISPTQVNLTAQYANRFARASHSINALALEQPRRQVTPRVEAIDYNSNNGITQTVRIVDFLSLVTEGEGEEAVTSLELSADVSNDIIRPFFTDRLGIAATTANRWLGSAERRIPLDELRTEAGLADYVSLETFTGLAQLMLTPPDSSQATYEKLTSQTERFFIVLQDIKDRLPTLADPSGGYRTDFRVLNDGRFHQGISAGSSRQNDTVDTYTYWFVPSDAGFTLEQYVEVIHDASGYARIDPNFLHSSVVTDHPDADPDRVYTDTELKIPLADNLLYRISVSREPVTFAGGVHLSAWVLEERHNVSRQGFYDNAGAWGFIPVTIPGNGGTAREGWMVIRGGILNSNAPVDRNSQVESQGRDGLVLFAEETTSAAAAYARTGNLQEWSSGDSTVLDYRIGRIVDHEGNGL